MFYTGTGARGTPKSVLAQMESISESLAKSGWTLRSGGSSGAETSFENGCEKGGGLREIFLPWDDYNGKESELSHPSSAAYSIASRIWDLRHEKGDMQLSWKSLQEPTRHLMARNVHQILGRDLDLSSKAVICWTDDSPDKGGTGMIIWLSHIYNIPILDLNSSKFNSKVEVLNYMKEF